MTLDMPFDPQTQLPLTEPTFFILLSLAPGPNHGYAILKSVQALSQQRVLLSTGTLYGALKRLLEIGWIARIEQEAIATGRVTHSYELTNFGRRVLGAETARLQSLVEAARKQVSEGLA